ncbi:transglycosylase SLT domain-containing protein [Colwellia sp. MSW7]|uniref:Transglycosylase SLT domain-containing protein n=1 Tax=Colwellia maritima TaxID=2912588 RepID=A0ABS9WWG5_9GAMM|nr:transglycosylase SLT domain-containing protein [Colwellia maritima]MCI2282307.1 transglycosylase SLT domain-containing protein [Colwellia maritima]
MLTSLVFKRVLALIIVIYSSSLCASEPLKLTVNKIQQENFIKAEKLTHKSNSAQYQTLYNQLHYYPLQPYLDQQRLIHKMKLSDATEIDTFLEKYQGTPLDWPLRKKWLNYLADKKQGLLFLQAYKPTSNVELTCHQLNFSLQSGIPETVILPQVTKLWVVGRSQDKACDPLFERWQKAGYRTNDRVWQRISLAADGGKHTLIPYLTKLLPINQQYLGKLWHKVRRDPSIVSKLKYFPNNSDKETEILTYGLKRLIWRHPETALSSYKKAQLKFAFTQTQQQEITEKFALALSSKKHQLAQLWLDKLDFNLLSKNMLQWRLSQALKQRDWERLIIEIKQLPSLYKDDLKWKYWYARALIETGSHERGDLVLQQVANERHYYGFLAASYLKIPVNLQNKPLNFTLVEKRNLISYPAAKRAFEFHSMGRYRQARSEWNYLISQLNDREKLVAAKIANENQWFDRTIFTLANVGYLDDVALRFPKAFDKEINYYALAQKIAPSWAFAIARRESSFMHDANSPVGAKGLMQLMPNTAKHLKKGKINTRYLLNAKNNIQLGTKYLKILLGKTNGNAVLATAAYNAGPYRVGTWVDNAQSVPADIWIEMIPYKETRNYVKSVLAYQEIYQNKPGQVSQIFENVINMSIGG